jgi:flagellar protein FliO/FliZ
MRSNISLTVSVALNALLLCSLIFSNLVLAQVAVDKTVDNTTVEASSQHVPTSGVTAKENENLVVVESIDAAAQDFPKQTSTSTSTKTLPLKEEKVPVVGKHVGGNMDAMTMIVSLLLVLAMVVAFAFITKRFQPARLNSQGISLVTSMALSAKERIIVIQVGDKQQLLGVTAQQITLLDTLDEPLTMNKPLTAELGQSFMGLLQKRFQK